VNKKYIINGQKGVIGSSFVEIFKDLNIEYDIYDNNKTSSADTFLHLAAKAYSDSDGYIDSNILLTKEIIEYCYKNGIKNLIFFSAARIYGDQNRENISEDDELKEPNMYAVSKLFAERMLEECNLNVLVVRLPGVISHNSKTGVLSSIYNRLTDNEDIVLTNYDKKFNNFVSVDNIFEFINQYEFDKKYLLLNLASDKNMSLFEIVSLMKEMTNSNSKIILDDKKSNFFNISIDKAIKHGYKPYNSKDDIINWINSRNDFFKKFDNIKPANNAKSLSFFCTDKNGMLNNDMINELKRVAFETKKNVRLNLHSTPESGLHSMIIFQWNNSFLKPHKHESKSEICHIIEGKQRFFLFNEEGKVLEKIDNSSTSNMVVLIDENSYHTSIIDSEYVIFNEVKRDPYLKEKDSVFPEWAPNNLEELNNLISKGK
jgi:cupin fold WbuC family metalloprotein